MNISKKLDPYRNRWGFVTHNGKITHHDALFGAFEVDLLKLNGQLKGTTTFQIRKRFSKLLLEPGLLMRNAENLGPQESHDNTRAMLYVMHLIGGSYAKDFLNYGRAHFWSYNNEEPGRFTWSSFLGRFQDLIAQAQISAGEYPGLLRLTWLSLAFILAAHAKRKNIEARTLMYFTAKTVKGEYRMVDWAINYWIKKTKKAFTGGMSEILETYGLGGHPYVMLYNKSFPI